MALLLMLSSLGRENGPTRLQSSPRPLDLLGWRPALVFVLAPSAIILVGLFTRLPEGLSQLGAVTGFADDLLRLIAGSFIVALGTGVLTALVLIVLMMTRPEGWTRKLLLGFVAPSTVITGFALLIFWRATGWASLMKISLGLTMIAVPSFYRLYWDSWLQALRGQVAVAKTLGASEALVLGRVLLPQLASPLMFLAGLSAFWAWGDFALSAVLGERALTVAMLAHGLMGSYRLPAATVVVCGILLGGTLTFTIFWGAGRVLGSRSQV
jgi:ABC-type Fe3+ transport system permease subunit